MQENFDDLKDCLPGPIMTLSDEEKSFRLGPTVSVARLVVLTGKCGATELRAWEGNLGIKVRDRRRQGRALHCPRNIVEALHTPCGESTPDILEGRTHRIPRSSLQTRLARSEMQTAISNSVRVCASVTTLCVLSHCVCRHVACVVTLLACFQSPWSSRGSRHPVLLVPCRGVVGDHWVRRGQRYQPVGGRR